jgi:hypothetical protein
MPRNSQYLRTNWRQTGQKLALDAVGGGLAKGSFMRAGSGFGSPVLGGGLIFHHVSAETTALVGFGGVASLPAQAVLNSIYGAGLFGEGWKIQPYAVWPRIIQGYNESVATSVFNIVWSLTVSDDSTIKWYAQLICLTADCKLSYFSATWDWAGFIISSP